MKKKQQKNNPHKDEFTEIRNEIERNRHQQKSRLYQRISFTLLLMSAMDWEREREQKNLIEHKQKYTE